MNALEQKVNNNNINISKAYYCYYLLFVLALRVFLSFFKDDVAANLVHGPISVAGSTCFMCNVVLRVWGGGCQILQGIVLLLVLFLLTGQPWTRGGVCLSCSIITYPEIGCLPEVWLGHMNLIFHLIDVLWLQGLLLSWNRFWVSL